MNTQPTPLREIIKGATQPFIEGDSPEKRFAVAGQKNHYRFLHTQRCSPATMLRVLEALEAAIAHHALRCDLAKAMGFQPPSKESWVTNARAALDLLNGIQQDSP